MAVKKLTDVTLRALKAPKTGRLELWDSLLPGFGVRVTEKDARSFFVMYRHGAGEDRKQKRLKIGDARILDLATARDRARKALEQAQIGIDPALRAKAADARPAGFRATAVDYLERYVDAQTRGATTKEWRRIFEVDLIPEFKDRPLPDIKRNDIEKLLDKITKRGPIYANRVLARLKHFFQWCIDRELCDTSPAARFKPVIKEEARDRVLTDAETRWFVKACGEIGEPFGPLFHLLLLTAQRRDEVATMEWTEIDLPSRLWTIPREKAKNGHAHEVALSDQAMAIVIRLAENRTSSRFVFSTTGIAPVSGFSKAKPRLDKAMEKHRWLELGLLDDNAGPGIENFTLHDLRRTAATGMAGLGIPPHVTEKVLNHTGGTIRGVAAVYNRFAYSAERREALEKWGRHVAAIATA